MSWSQCLNPFQTFRVSGWVVAVHLLLTLCLALGFSGHSHSVPFGVIFLSWGYTRPSLFSSWEALSESFSLLILTFLLFSRIGKTHSWQWAFIFTPPLSLLPRTADSLPSCTVESCHQLLTSSQSPSPPPKSLRMNPVSHINLAWNMFNFQLCSQPHI